ncbi:major capsid protein [Undibacterium sp. Jales W-56]|uniref:major capsid protein n=1 Tax=Undibacterium sp. Jales W-56 TaxID=2897325 RepID=UPI0021D1E3F5|nr:major capsid protein [Undibacterium sp. Jales W-56]MCU6432633.1 major capsid protein [Undibacterium sp. Jales W-56]
MQNIFENPAFSMTALTTAINLLPNNYDRLERMNLFPPKPQRFRSITVEEKNGVLTLLPTMPVGSPGTVGVRGKRKVRSFSIPHIPHDDVILPEEVQGIRAFGSESEIQTVAGVMAEHLQTMRNKHAITVEHLRFGALKGQILDADGSTIYDLFDEFGITQKVFTFTLSDPDFDVKKACLDVTRYVEDNLEGERMSGLLSFVGEDFYDALTGHDQVLEAYNRWQDGQALRSDMRSGFAFAGITFEEHRGRAVGTGNSVRRFVGKGEGYTFPLGTMDTFATYYAPADFNETANTVALPLYAKQEPRKFDRGTDLHTQANPLPLCHRPALLVKLEMA